MKNLTSKLGLIALIVGTAGAFAMAPGPKKITVKGGTGELYWINADGSDGGFMNANDKAKQCGPEQVECARGYQSIDPTTGEGVGAPTILLGELE